MSKLIKELRAHSLSIWTLVLSIWTPVGREVQIDKIEAQIDKTNYRVGLCCVNLEKAHSRVRMGRSK